MSALVAVYSCVLEKALKEGKCICSSGGKRAKIKARKAVQGHFLLRNPSGRPSRRGWRPLTQLMLRRGALARHRFPPALRPVSA